MLIDSYLLLVFFVEQLHLLVEVGFEKAVLNDTVFLKLVFGVFFGDFSSDFTDIFHVQKIGISNF